MGASEHRIGRVVFDVDVPDRAAGEAFGAMVRARFDAVIAPALDAALGRIDRPGESIRLDRLELDLGALDAPAPDAGAFARRLAEALARALDGARPEAGAQPPGPDDAGELIGFLDTGTLPWREPGRALEALVRALLALDPAGMARLAERVRPTLIRRRAAERAARQLPAALLLRLLRALLPPALAAPLALIFGPDGPVGGRGGGPSGEPAPAALAPALAETIRRLAAGIDPPEPGEVVAVLAALQGAPLPPAAPPPSAQTPSAEPSAEPAAAEPAARERRADRQDEAAAVAAWPVHAAGAVLLHPFLARFFDRLGLLAAPGRFRDDQARARAVLLAHHLATGADEAPEPETLLFKLLCGMEPGEPVPRRTALDGGERDEAEALLNAVIGHWRRLGRTSPAGLRDGFLLRPGRLERREGWRLTVETRGVDVLLEDLPWALSRVATPFMRAPLTVDWR
jgi:hypothetical protein